MPTTAELAYALWERRGRPLGDDWADWFAAETALRMIDPGGTLSPPGACGQPKLLVLLGAGASMPGMLSTTDVTAQLRAWSSFREPHPAAPIPGSPLLPALVGVDPRPPLFDALFAAISGGVT